MRAQGRVQARAIVGAGQQGGIDAGVEAGVAVRGGAGVDAGQDHRRGAWRLEWHGVRGRDDAGLCLGTRAGTPSSRERSGKVAWSRASRKWC